MKKQVFICLMALCTLSAFAQDKTGLTKQETISYLNKTFQKTIGYKCIHVGCATNEGSITAVKFSVEEDQDVKYTYTIDQSKQPCYCCWDSYTVIEKFNPANISTVELDAKYNDPPAYHCTVKFVNNSLVQHTWKNTISKTNEVKLYFLMAEANDFEKLKTALLHLRDLYKAQDDPFDIDNLAQPQGKPFKSWAGVGSLMDASETIAEFTLKQYKFVNDIESGTTDTLGLRIKYFFQEDVSEYCVIVTKNDKVALTMFNMEKGDNDYYSADFDAEKESFENSATSAGFKPTQTLKENGKDVQYFYNSKKKQKIRIEKVGSSEYNIFIYNEDMDIQVFL